VATAERKRFEEPDETRTFPDGEGAVLRFGDVSLAMGRLRPGWSFERSMKALVGQDSCPFRHVGYALSGRLSVRMDDGSEIEVNAGDGYMIPSGHQAAVVGEEDFVALEFDSGAIDRFGVQH
jgi:hypothetical protein